MLPRRIAVFALALAGCLSPTLPLPPPDAPGGIEAADAGSWRIRGDCAPGAEVLIRDEASGVIAGVVDVRHSGHYVITLTAALCDFADVQQILGDNASTPVRFRVQPTQDGLPIGDSHCGP